jgi:hypothetical protein
MGEVFDCISIEKYLIGRCAAYIGAYRYDYPHRPLYTFGYTFGVS